MNLLPFNRGNSLKFALEHWHKFHKKYTCTFCPWQGCFTALSQKSLPKRWFLIGSKAICFCCDGKNPIDFRADCFCWGQPSRSSFEALLLLDHFDKSANFISTSYWSSWLLYLDYWILVTSHSVKGASTGWSHNFLAIYVDN